MKRLGNVSNSVYVIDLTTTNAAVANVRVGVRPWALDINPETNMIYVANTDSSTVSVIDGHSNKVVVGVTFKISPSGSGHIQCNSENSPSRIGQYMFVYSGAQCTAQPNEGFEFSSWEENNLKDNSTQPISVSRPTSSLDSFLEFLHPKSADKPEATLTVTKFGIFTANFKEAPPPLPPEFWVQMYAVIGTVVTALFIPSIVGWFKSKRETKKLNYYHKQIAILYDDGKLDENDIETLDRLRRRVSDAYSEGKLNERRYESLKEEISTLYEEIFRNKIASLNDNRYSPIKKPTQDKVAQIRNEVEHCIFKRKDKHEALRLIN